MTRSTPLKAEDGPLVWIDCEMTGLNVQSDVIIEIAVIITDGNLQPVDEGIEYVIKTEKAVLENMNEWCINQHGKSGLTQACLDSPHTYEQVYASVLEYVQKWVPDQRVAILAGSSVHADAKFLARGMPKIIDHLHYRIVDVSTVKELVKRWYPPSVVEGGEQAKTQAQPNKEASHRALDDIRASIRELERYRQEVFISPESYLQRKATSQEIQNAGAGATDRRASLITDDML